LHRLKKGVLNLFLAEIIPNELRTGNAV
jgi:hypothetical protein